MVGPASNSQKREVDSAKSEPAFKEMDPITEKMKAVLEPIEISSTKSVKLSKVEDQESSRSPDLIQKALADVQTVRPQPSELLINKTFSSSLVARVEELNLTIIMRFYAKNFFLCISKGIQQHFKKCQILQK